MSRRANAYQTGAFRSRRRGYSFEALERRDYLTVAPVVLDIEVASTAWSPAFVSNLHSTGQGTNGYSIPQGSSVQSSPLTWDNINQVILTFDQDVLVAAADLAISGVNTSAYAISEFHYDPQAHVATWTLATSLNKDRVRLDLDANGIAPVRSLGGTILDGEWTNNVSTASGNGTAGGDFQFNFNVLPTDVNNSGNITTLDYISIRQLDGKSIGSSGYIAKRDVNGNGIIDSYDWQQALNRAGQVLPTGSPAGTNNDAPTTLGVPLSEITDAEVDVAISLMSRFDDSEDGSSGLIYSIVANNNPSLFDTASINQSTKELVVNAASDVSGRADFVVRATDSGGQFVDTVVTVDVGRENKLPQISNFQVVSVGVGTFMVTGDVTDPDDDVRNFIVYFSGAFETRAAVNDSGHFSFAVDLPDYPWEMEYAETWDPHGGHSNVAFADITPT